MEYVRVLGLSKKECMAVYKEGLKNHATEYQMSQEETKEMIDELTSEGYYEINEYDTGNCTGIGKRFLMGASLIRYNRALLTLHVYG